MNLPGDLLNWAIVIGAGAVTFFARASFVVLPAGAHLPPRLLRGLKYVAAAVLPALILPDVLFRDLPPGAVVNWFRIIATLVAVVIALRTRNVFATLGGGMAVLWLLKWWSPL